MGPAQSLGTVESNASVGLEPTIIGIGPLPAVRKALANAGHEIGDIDPFELNEAFAAQPLAVLHELKNKAGRINPHGGAVTLGHPIGANGAKIPVTLPHQTQRTTTNQGHATPCIAGGQGQAIVIRRSANRDTA